jgi:hypothetical protein
MVHVIASKPSGLRRDATENTATDILVVIFSADMYQALAIGRDWSHIRCTRFFKERPGSRGCRP